MTASKRFGHRMGSAIRGGVLLGGSLLTVVRYEVWVPPSHAARSGADLPPVATQPCETPIHMLEIRTRLFRQPDGLHVVNLLFGTAMFRSASFLASAPVMDTSWPDRYTFEIRLQGPPDMDLAMITINPPGHHDAFTTACGEKMATQLLMAETGP